MKIFIEIDNALNTESDLSYSATLTGIGDFNTQECKLEQYVSRNTYVPTKSRRMWKLCSITEKCNVIVMTDKNTDKILCKNVGKKPNIVSFLCFGHTHIHSHIHTYT